MKKIVHKFDGHSCSWKVQEKKNEMEFGYKEQRIVVVVVVGSLKMAAEEERWNMEATQVQMERKIEIEIESENENCIYRRKTWLVSTTIRVVVEN